MKTFIISLICLVALACALFAFLDMVDDDISQLANNADLVYRAVCEENWGLAEGEFEIFLDMWTDKSAKMRFFLDHALLDCMSERLASVGSFIKTHAQKEAQSELSIIKMQLEAIRKNEMPTLANIF